MFCICVIQRCEQCDTGIVVSSCGWVVTWIEHVDLPRPWLSVIPRIKTETKSEHINIERRVPRYDTLPWMPGHMPRGCLPVWFSYSLSCSFLSFVSSILASGSLGSPPALVRIDPHWICENVWSPCDDPQPLRLGAGPPRCCCLIGF